MSTQLARIKKARMGIILDAPFFGSLLMRLNMVREDDKQTFCTDGKRIAFNEEFAASLSDDELKGVLVHEVCHVAQGHLWRMDSRDPERWNHATDYQINQFLTDYTAEMAAKGKTVPWKLPEGGLIDPQFKGMASEQIYHALPTGSGGKGKPSAGEFEAPAPEADGTSSEDAWKVAITQAANAAKMQGSCPGCVQRMVGEVLAPKVPWREVLREFIRAQARDDFSWRKPNRRYAAQGIILPGLFSERMGRLVIAIDTSGSIGEKELAEFQAEAQCALDECSPEAIDVIYCDAAINGTAEFLPGDAVKLKPMGGGGTAFAPVFAHVEAMDEPPVALIYLTDGYGSHAKQEPEYPVLWATTGTDKFPWGTVVAVK
jgi:predicted metal-dependent peptidase